MKVILLILIALTMFTPAQAAPAAGVARVVVADCRESVIIWQNAPAVGLPGSSATVIFHTDTGAPFIVYYDYEMTLRNGNAVYRPDWWHGLGLHNRTITVMSGTIYANDNPIGYVAADDVFSIVCERVFVPVVVR